MQPLLTICMFLNDLPEMDLQERPNCCLNNHSLNHRGTRNVKLVLYWLQQQERLSLGDYICFETIMTSQSPVKKSVADRQHITVNAEELRNNNYNINYSFRFN